MDPSEYAPVVDRNGQLVTQDGYGWIQHCINGNFLQLPLLDLAHLYNLTIVEEAHDNSRIHEDDLENHQFSEDIGLSPISQQSQAESVNVGASTSTAHENAVLFDGSSDADEINQTTEFPDVVTKTIVTWTDQQTRCMLKLYLEYMDQIGPLKRLKNKRHLWEKLRDELAQQIGATFSASQVENRFKNVLKRNKVIMKNNRTSGSTRVAVPYEQEMLQISALDDSMDPELIMTPHVIIRKTLPSESDDSTQGNSSSNSRSASHGEENTDPENFPPSPPPPTKPKDVQSKLYEAYMYQCAKRDDRARERMLRHEEKMQRFDRFNDILAEICRNVASGKQP